MIMESKQAIHNIYFLFSRYHVKTCYSYDQKLELSLLVVLILRMIKFGTPKLVYPRSVYRCRKQPVLTAALACQFPSL